MIGLDTSVLVRLLIGEPIGLAEKAKTRLVEAHRQRQRVVVSDLVLAEGFHALKYHYGIEPAAIRSSMLQMFTSGLVQPEAGSGALAVLSGDTSESTVGIGRTPGRASQKAGFVDRLILSRNRIQHLTTWTVDKAQAKLGHAEYIG